MSDFGPNGQQLITVPCPKCGHRNRWKLGNVTIVKKWLTGELPPCKECGRAFDSESLSLPWREDCATVHKAREELAAEGKGEIPNLTFGSRS